MKKIFYLLLISFSVNLPFVFAQGNNLEQGRMYQNQGESTQLQAGEQAIEPAGIQLEQRLRDGSEEGAMNQNQNQGDVSQVKNMEKETKQKGEVVGLKNSEQRRSGVANAVQEMLQIGERNGGIGEQVREIARAQNQDHEKIEASLQKVQNRGGFVKFLVGPDYKEINNAKNLLEKNKERIMILNQIKDQVTDPIEIETLAKKSRLLEEVNSELESSLEEEQKGFSLFGWLFRRLNK